MEPGIPIDHAQIARLEPDDMSTMLVLDDADQFAHQRFADEVMLTTPLDRAVREHPAHLIVRIVPGLVHACRQEPLGRLPAALAERA